MPVEWVNRRAGESAKRRTRVETDEKKQHQKPNGRIRETAKKRVRHFRDLDVYQNALETALRVYELSKKFPDGERYALIKFIVRRARFAQTLRRHGASGATQRHSFPSSAIPKARPPKRKCTWSLQFVTATSVTPNSKQSMTRTNTYLASSYV